MIVYACAVAKCDDQVQKLCVDVEQVCDCMFILLQRLDDIVVEEFEEGDYQEQEYQDQGQVADQGKPPKLIIPSQS